MSENGKERRRILRQQNKAKKNANGPDVSSSGTKIQDDSVLDRRISQLLMKREDDLLTFVAKVNKVYQEKLRKPAPFMTFVFCGMQSSGKSTIMERFMNAVLNIVQEGTGTRCPLDTTCIHDRSCTQASCELSGQELQEEFHGTELWMKQVFERITEHNRKLAEEDRFSTEPLYLVFRSNQVQNMRFVDTPGIISNKSTGKDNRKDIEQILRSEMCKPNTKLCVLLEPKEFATNPIIEFCDTTFGHRNNWIDDATFLMTKFDKQLHDSRTSSKANNFFKEFHENKCFPHLAITPTLAKEDLPSKELFKARKDLIESSNSYEKERFNIWLQEHQTFRDSHNDPTELDENISKRIGFPTAKKIMREIMLDDTARRLPEVLSSLRQELSKCQKEESILKDKLKYNDPKELKLVVSEMLWSMRRRVMSYLDGDLEASVKFPEKLQTLEEEIDEEEESEWASKDLNHYTENEDRWRDQIADVFQGEYPESIQSEEKFLGGKQVQRAIEFFRVVMIETLPDPAKLRPFVKSSTGFLAGGLQRENWEGSVVQLTKIMIKDVTHPGINYLIKHVGSILRRLVAIAMDDVKEGAQFSSSFKLLPQAVEKYLMNAFDDVIWSLMNQAAERTHCALEPMYSTVDPNLPTFVSKRFPNDEEEQEKYVLKGGTYVKAPSKQEEEKESMLQKMKNHLQRNLLISSENAKQFLMEENKVRSTAKQRFLPDERTSMVTEKEIDVIIQRSFEYLVALMEFNLVTLRFQLTHYLYQTFKEELQRIDASKLLTESEWESLVEVDGHLEERLEEICEQIKGLTESLQDVQRMQRML